MLAYESYDGAAVGIPIRWRSSFEVVRKRMGPVHARTDP